ncbi:2-dehydropantoate 2-reductase [Acidisoma cellulosilytica]|uniref:2-dehydropantoate 2-reductase n=2 Tax=Acidisoma cellulosilyticum TaxID=2802395 RepID=A0A964E6T9_9PROT|nr:2-dehydropantoate 2-reductase [Acidisoma cellulosilyticum]
MTQTDKIAIIGSGGIGGYLAASLVRGGHKPMLCVRTAFDTLRIEEKGNTYTVDLPIVSDPAGVAGPARWVLITTKANDTPSTEPWLKALVDDKTTVVVVQNGVNQEQRVLPYVPEGTTVLPAVIYCAVERKAPGLIVHHGAARIQVPEGSEGAAFDTLFDRSGFEIVQDSDFKTVAWRKLLSNAVANAITALTLRRMSVFMEEPVRQLAGELLEEVIAVAQAEGAAVTREDGDAILKSYDRISNGGTSMLYDRLLGRELEHKFITGAVVEAAGRHGIAVPVNRTISALLSAASGHKPDGSA